MGYYQDLSAITLAELKRRLEVGFLLPSQRALGEDLDARLAALQRQGIDNLLQLQDALKAKPRVAQFAEVACLPVEFLTILRREVNGYHPQPRKVRDFVCISPQTKKILTEAGLTTTPDLYAAIATRAGRARLQKDLGLPAAEIRLLAKLADLCRLRYVNPAFATLLAHSTYGSVAKLQTADHAALHAELARVNAGKRYYTGNFSERDAKFLPVEAGYHEIELEEDT